MDRRVQSYRSRPAPSRPLGPSCVICFKVQTIFSIGACDHPVCYECSTTMRVLCDQKECPICRRILTKVIFTKEVDLFKNLDDRQYSRYNKKYGIAFDDHSVEHSFEQLMRCYCKKCYDRPDFAVFEQLASHMERNHRLFACRLCVKHLKIFPSQRRWYNYDELARHEECGDPENTSHRGHPACHFCNTRYLDKDELYKHLRKEHFYCHFCDADGIQDYYMSYEWLRKHFNDKHYLCEEGNCINEQFTSVFRTAIDLQAHKAQTHSRELGKHASKEARTLRLEFNLRPRHNPTVEAGRPNQYQPPQDNSCNSSHISDRTINVRNTSDFPSLNGQHTTVLPCARTRKQNQSVNTRDLNSFPALGQEAAASPSKPLQKPATNNNRMAAAAVLKKPAEPSRLDRNRDIAAGPSASRLPNQARDFPSLDGNQQTSNKVKEMSVAPNSAVGSGGSWVSKAKTANENGQDEKKKTKKEPAAIKKKIAEAPKVPGPLDFPNLNKKLEPSKSNLAKLGNKKKVDNNPKKNIGNPTENNNQNGKKNDMSSMVPQHSGAEHNTNNNNNFKKLTDSGNKENSRPKSKSEQSTSPQYNGSEVTITKKNTNSDGVNKSMAEPKRELSQSKKKETIPSLLTKTNESTVAADANNPKDKKKRKKNENGREPLPSSAVAATNLPRSRENNQQHQHQHHSKPQPATTNVTPKVPPGFEHSFHQLGVPGHRPPPGMSGGGTPTQAIKAPPGLSRLINGDTGKPYEYLHPVSSTVRNKVLINNLMAALVPARDRGFDTFEKFKEMSTLFRRNLITAYNFYSYCVEMLSPHAFETIFLELVLLLPDIQKQQELLIIYNRDGREKMNVEICKYCHQILRTSDMEFHFSAHSNNATHS